jgi:hypothetical protein
MVIDETARPESVSSQKTTSPAPGSNAAGGLQPPGAGAAASSSKYEPLSDDD